MAEQTVTVKRGEYKGHQMLVLSNGPEDKFPFQFGYRKAKLILAALEDVKKFVAEGDAKAAAATK